MNNWKEFDIYIKYPDNDIIGKEGESRKVKTTVDLSKIVFFYESSHEKTEEKGTSLNFSSGEDLFIVVEYNVFKQVMSDFNCIKC